MKVDDQPAGGLTCDMQAAEQRMTGKMVLGEGVLTGHGYDSLRRGVEEGYEVDGGEVDEWVIVRVRRERARETAALRLRPQKVAYACQARQCNRGGVGSQHL